MKVRNLKLPVSISKRELLLIETAVLLPLLMN